LRHGRVTGGLQPEALRCAWLAGPADAAAHHAHPGPGDHVQRVGVRGAAAAQDARRALGLPARDRGHGARAAGARALVAADLVVSSRRRRASRSCMQRKQCAGCPACACELLGSSHALKIRAHPRTCRPAFLPVMLAGPQALPALRRRRARRRRRTRRPGCAPRHPDPSDRRRVRAAAGGRADRAAAGAHALQPRGPAGHLPRGAALWLPRPCRPGARFCCGRGA